MLHQNIKVVTQSVMNNTGHGGKAYIACVVRVCWQVFRFFLCSEQHHSCAVLFGVRAGAARELRSAHQSAANSARHAKCDVTGEKTVIYARLGGTHGCCRDKIILCVQKHNSRYVRRKQCCARHWERKKMDEVAFGMSPIHVQRVWRCVRPWSVRA